MAELSKDTIDATLIDVTLGLVDGLTERLEAGIEVADIGCGAGYAMNVLGRAFPNSRFTGFDIVGEVIDTARAQAEEWGLSNVTFEVRTWPTSGDRAPRPGHRVRRDPRPGGIRSPSSTASPQSLKADGVFLCVDVAAPAAISRTTSSTRWAR